MVEELHVALAGTDSQVLANLAGLLHANPDYRVAVKPFHQVNELQQHCADSAPHDLLILHISGEWEAELASVMGSFGPDRCALVVVSSDENPRIMRMAMQAGARDFFNYPLDEPEFLKAIQRLFHDKRLKGRSENGYITGVINAKGGSGASVVASSIAHILTIKGRLQTALLDVDLQFGALAQYFDIQSENGLLQALDVLDTLDVVALEGYMMKHKSGLHLLGTSRHEHLVLPGAEEIPQADARISAMLDLLVQRYSQVVVDLPRQVDPFTGVVLQRADQVVIVLQQSLAHIRDAQLLLAYLRELSVQPERVHILVNRFDKKNQVQLSDIEKALHQKCFDTIPNDYVKVSESVNLGIPLLDHAPNTDVTRKMIRVAETLSVRPFPEEKKGLFGRVLSLGGNG